MNQDDGEKLHEVFDAVNNAMTPVLNRYIGRAPMVSTAVIAILSNFISVTAKDPETILKQFGDILSTTDWQLARQMHTGAFKMEIVK